MTRSVALVAVGVNQTEALAKLQGAAAGAKLLAEWFDAQRNFGVNVTIEVLVDEQADGSTLPVRVSDVQDVVDRVTGGSIDMLTIYLAGHGIVKSGTDEQVLLSKASRYPQEAINVVATAQAARFCGVPHVVIISDACRNAIDPFSPLGTIAGVPVIRRKGVVGIRPSQVDVFYATEPSQTAKEYYGEGFFTKILCRVLTEPPQEICEVRQEYAPNRVIDGYMLGAYLRDAVPHEAVAALPGFDQTPDAIVQSRLPSFMGFAPPTGLLADSPGDIPLPDLETTPLATEHLKDVPASTGPPPLWEVKKSLTPYILRFDIGRPPGKLSVLELAAQGRLDSVLLGSDILSSPGLNKYEALLLTLARLAYPEVSVDPDVARMDLAVARLEERFMTYLKRLVEYTPIQHPQLAQFGITVRGAYVSRVFAHDSTRRLDGQERGPARDHAAIAARTIMVELDDRAIAPLPLIPGKSVIACVADGVVQDVILEHDVAPETIRRGDRVALLRRRAVMASLAASAKLHLVGDIEPKSRLPALVMHDDGLPDPTLVLYAAYACALAGNNKGLSQVIRRNGESISSASGLGNATVFDLSLLAGTYPKTQVPLAPFCPMMSLGWSFLSGTVAASKLHPALALAAPLRLNAEWTTFRSAECGPLLEALELKELPWT